MKEGGSVLVVAYGTMAGVSPVAPSFLSQQPFPTPSPFSFSVASTRQSSRPSIRLCSLVLRSIAVVFSFVSALSMATSSAKKKGQRPSFTEHSELLYSFVIAILAFIYSGFQLLKAVYDIADRGIGISEMISDYASFIFDQLVGYLLISSSSTAIPVLQHIQQAAPLWKAAIISTTMSFATFIVIAISALLSGYKLCKRISW